MHCSARSLLVLLLGSTVSNLLQIAFTAPSIATILLVHSAVTFLFIFIKHTDNTKYVIIILPEKSSYLININKLSDQKKLINYSKP